MPSNTSSIVGRSGKAQQTLSNNSNACLMQMSIRTQYNIRLYVYTHFTVYGPARVSAAATTRAATNIPGAAVYIEVYSAIFAQIHCSGCDFKTHHTHILTQP